MKMGSLLSCLVLLLAGTLRAQDGNAGAGGYDALQKDFTNVYESLRARGGLSPADRPVLQELRKRAASFNAGHPDNPRSLALELQLALWLGDEEGIDALYGKLTALTSDPQFGLAWVRHFQESGDRRRVGEIYQKLATLFPGDARVRIGWAEFFREANLYERALSVLEAAHLDPGTTPAAAILLGECLFAEQRFPEAVAALEAIPPEALSADQALRAKVESLLAARRAYPALWEQEQQLRSAEARPDDLPRVEIDTPQGRIVVELFENEAPGTVANFVALAESGFYDATRFHRVVPNSMAEGGDPNTRPGATGTPGTGGPGYRIPDEFDREGARKHFAGSLGMANSGTPHSGGSRFYVTFVPVPELNGKHTVFGRVVEGLDLVRSLQADDAIESVTVLRKRDHDYKPQALPEPPPAAAAPPPPPPAAPPPTAPPAPLQP